MSKIWGRRGEKSETPAGRENEIEGGRGSIGIINRYALSSSSDGKSNDVI